MNRWRRYVPHNLTDGCVSLSPDQLSLIISSLEKADSPKASRLIETIESYATVVLTNN